MTEIWSQTHKNPLKTHIEALKIIFSRGDPLTREGDPSRALPALVPSALDDFLCRTTFKYAATALNGEIALSLLMWVNHAKVGIFNASNMSFKAIRENKILTKIYSNVGQKYCRMLHSAILSTSIKLPIFIKIFVLSIFSGRFTQVLLYLQAK